MATTRRDDPAAVRLLKAAAALLEDQAAAAVKSGNRFAQAGMLGCLAANITQLVELCTEAIDAPNDTELDKTPHA